MAPHLDIQRSQRDDTTVLEVKGEIDLASVPELEQQLDQIEDKHVVIDLLGITFVDSTGLRTLIMANEQATERGGTLTLVAGPGPVTKLLQITGVDQHLSVADSVDAALDR